MGVSDGEARVGVGPTKAKKPGTSDNETSGIGQFFDRVRNGLFGVLFIIHKDSHHSAVWVKFHAIPWTKDVKWFQDFLMVFQPERYVFWNNIAFIVLITILGLMIANTIYVAWGFTQSRIRFIWSLRILRLAMTVFATVLYIPTLAQLTSMISHCDGGCWSGSNLFRSIVAIVIIVFFVFLSSLVCATFFECEPKVKDPLCRPHARIDMLYLAVRTVLTVLYVLAEVDEYATENKLIWVHCAFAIVGSFICFAGFIRYQPYYHKHYSALRTALMGGFFLASLAQAFTILRPNSDVGILFLILYLPIAALVVFLFNLRRTQLEKTKIEDCHDSLTVELKARLILEKANLLWYVYKSPGAAAATTTNAPKPGEDLGLAVGGAQATTALDLDKLAGETFKEANEVYIEAAKYLGGSAMLYLLHGQHYLVYLNNKHMALASYAKAEDKSPKFDEEYFIFRRRKQLSERFQASGGDSIDFIEYESHLTQAKRFERRTLYNQVQFWKEVSKKEPSFMNLHKTAGDISSNMAEAQSHYLKLIQLNSDSPQVYRLYGSFLLNVLNDQKMGHEMLDHAEELEKRAKERYEENEDGSPAAVTAGSVDFLSDENAIFVISGEPENVGQIISLNNAACRTYGYKKSELIGKNISIIVPAPLAAVHNAAIVKYLQTGITKIVDYDRKLLAVDKEGRLFPTSLLVRQVTDARNRTQFMGAMRRLDMKSNEHFMVLDGDYNIKRYTPGFGEIFTELVPEPVVPLPGQDYEVFSMYDLFGSEFEAKKEIFTARSGVKLAVTREGVQVEFKIFAEYLNVCGTEAYICKMKHTVFNDKPDGKLGIGYAFSSASMAASAMSVAANGKSWTYASNQPSRDALLDEGHMEVGEYATCPVTGKRGSGHGHAHPPVTASSAPEGITKRDRSMSTSSNQSHSHAQQNTAFLKSIIAQKNSSNNQKLQYLKAGYVIMLTIMSILAIALNVHYSTSFKTFEAAVTKVNSATQAELFKATAIFHVRTLDLIAKGIIPQASREDRIQKLRNAIEDLRAATMDLANVQSATVAERNLVSDPAKVSLRRSGDVTPVDVSLVDALQLIISGSTSVMLASPNTVEANANTDFLMRNSEAQSLTNTLIDVVREYGDEFIDFAEYSRTTELLLGILASALYLVMCLFTITPLIRTIENRKREFLSSFLEVPKEVSRGILESCAQKYDASIRDDLEEGEGESDQLLQLEGLANGELNMDVDMKYDKFASHHVSTDSYRVGTFDGLSRRWARFKTTTAISWSLTFTSRLIPKTVALALLITAYFLSSGILVSEFFRKATHISENIFWSHQRDILIREIDFNLREEILSQLNDKRNVTTYASKTVAAANSLSKASKLVSVSNDLLYGNSALHLSGAIEQTDAQNAYLLDSACVNSKSPADCATYYNGILTNGLHPFVLKFQEVVELVLKDVNSMGSSDSALIQYLLDASSAYGVLHALDFEYAPPALKASAEQYQKPFEDRVDWIKTYSLVFTIVFVVLLFAIYFIVYRPAVREFSDDVRRTYVMLYTIPTDIIGKVQALQNFVYGRNANFKPKTTSTVEKDPAPHRSPVLIQIEHAPTSTVEKDPAPQRPPVLIQIEHAPDTDHEAQSALHI